VCVYEDRRLTYLSVYILVVSDQLAVDQQGHVAQTAVVSNDCQDGDTDDGHATGVSCNRAYDR